MGPLCLCTYRLFISFRFTNSYVTEFISKQAAQYYKVIEPLKVDYTSLNQENIFLLEVLHTKYIKNISNDATHFIATFFNALWSLDRVAPHIFTCQE